MLGHTGSHSVPHLPARPCGPTCFVLGDTLFNAGAGNTHNGGSTDALYDTFAHQLSRLPDHTRLYPGHDYIESNLKFTLSREPDNAAAQTLLTHVTGHDPAVSVVTTLQEEKQHNTFFRLNNATIVAKLRESFPELPEEPDAKMVFGALRALRNKW